MKDDAMNNKMNDQENEKEIRALLKHALGPAKNTELKRDLWRQMLHRLDAQPTFRVPWFDWALAAVVLAALLFYPGAIPALLYQL